MTADVEVEGVDDNTKKDIDFDFEIIHKAVSSKAKECICRNVDFSDIPVYYYAENEAFRSVKNILDETGISYRIDTRETISSENVE